MAWCMADWSTWPKRCVSNADKMLSAPAPMTSAVQTSLPLASGYSCAPWVNFTWHGSFFSSHMIGSARAIRVIGWSYENEDDCGSSKAIVSNMPGDPSEAHAPKRQHINGAAQSSICSWRYIGMVSQSVLASLLTIHLLVCICYPVQTSGGPRLHKTPVWFAHADGLQNSAGGPEWHREHPAAGRSGGQERGRHQPLLCTHRGGLRYVQWLMHHGLSRNMSQRGWNYKFLCGQSCLLQITMITGGPHSGLTDIFLVAPSGHDSQAMSTFWLCLLNFIILLSMHLFPFAFLNTSSLSPLSLGALNRHDLAELNTAGSLFGHYSPVIKMFFLNHRRRGILWNSRPRLVVGVGSLLLLGVKLLKSCILSYFDGRPHSRWYKLHTFHFVKGSFP